MAWSGSKIMADSVADLVADLADWFHDQVDGEDPVETCETDGPWVTVAYESGNIFVLHVADDEVV